MTLTGAANLEPWEQNATKHADERLTGPREASWWYTGLRPEPGRCPGVDETGEIRGLPLPDLSLCGREEVLDYFDNAWTLHEVLFAGLQGAEAFYRPPDHNLRHPMIFYYGHTTALYVNKLRVAGLLDAAIDPYLEQVMEMGVDENSWDDMSKNDMVWPSVAEVKDYRAEVYRTVVEIIERTPFAPELGRPVTMDDQAWALLLAVEHDRIHLETSSVLIREMRARLVERPAAWPAPSPLRRTTATGKPSPGSVPDNAMVTIPGRTAKLGKPESFPSYGWDSAYGTRTQDLPDFDVSRSLISNGEFHAFVADGGYRRPELWSAEGEAWRRFRNTKWPRFWVPTGPTGLHTFRLRTLFDEIDMPWDWPAVVNFHEAKAFAAWKSGQDGRAYRLPTEPEYFLMRDLPDRPGVGDDVIMRRDGEQLREQGINLGLAWGSEGPVDLSPTTSQGVHDPGGNLWTWSEDTFNPLDGFTPHPYYEDFSVPSYGGQHQLILGGAYISTGELGSIWARHFYRPHFLQQAGIRLVSESEVDSRVVTRDREKPPVVVLVDTYETIDHGMPQTAEHIAPTFRALGAECVRVQSAAVPPGQYRNSSPTMENYRENIVHDGDLAATLAAVRAHDPIGVIAGGEYAVAFTDVLSEALGVPTNGTALSAARRDKFAMTEAITAAGLNGARQLLTGDEAELAAWHREIGGRIVVKPNRSAGGDGVSFCDTPEQAVVALRAITGRQNVFSEDNPVVLAQEYLVGTEYMIQTVSMDGLHQVCDIWKTHRFSLNGVTDLLGVIQLVPRRGPGHDELVDYAFAALDALDIRHGPAHIELKQTPDGPRLIEIGARMAGIDLPSMARAALGEAQFDWAADAVLRPDRFRARWGEDYQIKKHFAWAAMLSPVEGTLRGYRSLEALKNLESFRDLWVLTKPGQRLRRTIDDTTWPVAVALSHDIEEIVLRDLGTLRHLDGVGFYELES